MFKSKRKSKKLEISAPTNFCHRVHTDFDERQNKYVGLPLQWVSLVERNAKALETRPRGVVDPLQVTPTDMMDFNKVSRTNLSAEKHSFYLGELILTKWAKTPELFYIVLTVAACWLCSFHSILSTHPIRFCDLACYSSTCTLCCQCTVCQLLYSCTSLSSQCV